MIFALTVFQVIIAVFIIILVLLQFGKGAELGATMGGSSSSVFTASQQGNIFTKITAGLAVAFLVNSIVLSALVTKESSSSIMSNQAPVAAPLSSETETPAADTTTPAANTAAPAETKPVEKKEETKK